MTRPPLKDRPALRGSAALVSAAVAVAAAIGPLPRHARAEGVRGNLAQMMLATVDALPTKVAFRHRSGEAWKEITYRDWEASSLRLAAWLLDRGLKKGDRVSILCFNNPAWPTVDLAAQMVGAVVVPMYPSLTGKQHNYILHDAAIKVFFVMDRVHLEPIRRLAGALDGIQVVGVLPPGEWPAPSKEKLKEAGLTAAPPAEWPGGVVALDSILSGAAPGAAHMDEIRARVRSIGPDDLATICYTSGTTSAPPADDGTRVYAGKGVLLTHGNLLSNVDGLSQAVAIGPSDVFLSILPLAHMFERTCGYYAPVARGATIAYARSPATFVDDLGAVKPTIFACVPLLFERMYQKVFATADKKPINAALHGVVRVADFLGADEDRVAAFLDAKKARLLGKLLRAKTGGRLRFAVSGGAALSKDLAEFFAGDAKIQILEGYGLTETSPVLTCNRSDRFRFGTVGLPIPGAEIRIAPDGEILARGPMVMKGYLNNPEETAKAIDAEGYFHTGDLGAIVEGGFLRITGRKKSMFKLSTGKYISPETIENGMVHELVAQTLVCGENQRFAGMLIFPNLVALRTLASSLGVSGDDAALCADEKVRKAFGRIVDEACASLPDHERVKAFALVPAVLAIDSGELTPTLKVKRGVVAQKFASVIEGLFR
jgi:long-chain acyl-CoA synthetase